MYFNKIGGKIRNAKFTPEEQAALDEEIRRQVLASARRYEVENDAGILWALHEEFGFGYGRLKRTFRIMSENTRNLERYYELDKGDGGWISLRKLKEIGIDLEEWYKESGTEPVIEMK